MHLPSLVPLLTRHGYWIVVPLSAIEGPIVAVVTGAFAARGYFNPFVAFILFVGKDIVVDGGYYYAGRLAGAHPGSARLVARLQVTPGEVARVRGLWTNRSWHTMLVAKSAWGVSPIFLAVAGLVDLSPRTFFRCAIGVAALQYSVLILVGYYFGTALTAVSTTLRIIQSAVATAALAVIFYLRRRLRAEARASDVEQQGSAETGRSLR
jgi:membrane protein DedA with SNARE-associated domain